jgi:hypothetical protein
MLKVMELARLALSSDEKLLLLVILVIVMIAVVLFEMRVMRKKSKEVRMISQKKDEAYNAILTTKSVVHSLSNQGRSTGNASMLLERAKAAMNNDNFEKCVDLCAQAKKELTKPSTESGVIEKATDDDGGDRLEEVAENILSEGMAAPTDTDTYKGTKLNRAAEGNYLGAKFELTAAKADISRAAKAGTEVSEAETLMAQAETSFTAGNYDKALSFAVRARRSLNPDGSKEAIRLRKVSAKAGSEPEPEPEPESEPEVYDVEEEKTPSGFPCPKCGKLLDPTDVFCGNCGARLSKEKVCENCGAKAKPKDTFCRKCGERI